MITKIISNSIYFQEDESSKYSEIQKNILKKETQSKFKEIESRININLPEISQNNNFTKNFQAAKSVNDLLDIATLSNLSVPNALKLMSRIMNEINSGRSQMTNIETDKRFIHLRKMVKTNNRTKANIEISSDDLSQYSQLSTPAMISVSTIVICYM